MMNLIYIANDENACKSAEECGIEYLMVDLESIGKAGRQKKRDSRISEHTLDDVYLCRQLLKESKLLVRIDPNGNLKEQARVISDAKVDSIMIPMVKTADQLNRTLGFFEESIHCIPLIETLEALANIEEFIKLARSNYFHIGLNDLHLEAEYSFMFSMFNDERLLRCLSELRDASITFGVGGVSPVNQPDTLSPLSVLSLLNYTGSSGVILSRAFNRLHERCPAEFAQAVKGLRSSIAREQASSARFAEIRREIAIIERGQFCDGS